MAVSEWIARMVYHGDPIRITQDDANLLAHLEELGVIVHVEKAA